MTGESAELFYPNPQSGISFNIKLADGTIFSLTDFRKTLLLHLTVGTIVKEVWLFIPFKKSINKISMQPTLKILDTQGVHPYFGPNLIPKLEYPSPNRTYGTLSLSVDIKQNVVCEGMGGIASQANDLWDRYLHKFEPAVVGMQMHAAKEHKNYELINQNPYDGRNWKEINKITNGDYTFTILNSDVEIPETGDYIFAPFSESNYNWDYSSKIGTHKDYHNEIRFATKVSDDQYHSHNEAFFKNAMFMSNDDCDGYIWEKKHVPNDYIIFYPFYGAGWWRVYPQDRYAMVDWGLYNILNQRNGVLFRVGEFLVHIGNIGSSGIWLVSKDSKRWKETYIKETTINIFQHYCSGSHKDNFGMCMANDGKFYSIEIASDGTVTAEDTHYTSSSFDLFAYFGGYVYFTRKDDIKPHKTVYRLGRDGVRQTCITTEWGSSLNFGCVDQYYTCSCIKRIDNRDVRWFYYSTDGFLSAGSVSSLDEIQNYGDNWGVTYFDKQFYSHVRRVDAVIPGKYYWDCRQIITGGRIWQDTLKKYPVEFCGWQTPEPRQGVIPHTGHVFEFSKAYPGFDTTVSMNGGPHYFKDGKLSEQFGWSLYCFNDYTNAVYAAIIGNCDEKKKEPKYCVPPFDDCNGSFCFYSSVTNRNYLVDPNNDTWDLPW